MKKKIRRQKVKLCFIYTDQAGSHGNVFEFDYRSTRFETRSAHKSFWRLASLSIKLSRHMLTSPISFHTHFPISYSLVLIILKSNYQRYWRIRARIPVGAWYLSFIANVETILGAYPASCSLVPVVIFLRKSGLGVELTTHFHLRPRLRIHGSTPLLLPSMPSWLRQGQLCILNFFPKSDFVWKCYIQSRRRGMSYIQYKGRRTVLVTSCVGTAFWNRLLKGR